MAYFESCNIEFIDLTEVEEQERNWIINLLKSWEPNVKLPWKTFEDGQYSFKQRRIINSVNLIKSSASPIQGYTHLNNQLCDLKKNFQNDIYEPENNINVHSNGVDDNTLNIARNDSVENNGNEQSSNAGNFNKSGKSWASLFANETVVNHQRIEVKFENNITEVNSNGNLEDDDVNIPNELTSKYDDPNYYRMGEFLAYHMVDNRIISLQPRGLINRSNYCYINSILQALLACPPMYNLLCGLAKNVITEKKRNTPIIDSMAQFVKEFHHLPAGQRVGRRIEKTQKKELSISINCEAPFEPGWIYKILNGMRSDTFVVEGLQEDAEEFLGCLLNGLNDEMVDLIKLVNNVSRRAAFKDSHDKNNEVDKEWQVMGPKNKGCVTRRTEIVRTPISDIFGGHLRSRIHRTGDQSTDNIQPFFTLPLNIEKAATVREALEALVSKNQLEGVTSSKTNKEVEAWQQVTIEELPIVLILHLNCFDYQVNGCTKILKTLEFPIDLKVDSKLLSSKTNYTSKEKQYKLFAVVYHDGKEASKGHYVTDAYHVGYASWLRYDDASVKTVQEEQVLKPHGTRVPYLLFYRRSDSIKMK